MISGKRTFQVAAGAAAVYYGRRALRAARSETDLDGSVVLITGGSRGLGLLLARAFAGEGCRLVLCARDETELDRARRDLEARGADVLTQRCDVADGEQVERLVEAARARYGRIDVLVNNASVIQVGPLEAMTARDFEEALEVNCLGTIYPTLAVLPEMRARRSGRIVNITSIGGKVAVPHLLPYDSAKFAAVGFSEGLCSELAGTGVSVTTVIPGLMRTGSPVNAFFKGRQAQEFTWFSLGDALPFTSIDGARAARRIVDATRRGEVEVVLTWQAKLLRLAHDLFPSAVIRAFGTANRLLPGADGRSTERARGMELKTALAPSPLTALMNRAARQNNEYGGEPRPSPAHARKAGLGTSS